MSLFGRRAATLVVPALTGLIAFVSDVAHAAEEAGAEAHGKPNLFEAPPDLAIVSAIVFLIFLGVLTKFAWKPLAAGLDTRERRIRDDIAAAEEGRLKAERMLAEHAAKLDRVQDEVRAILAEARRDAEVARQNIVSDANAEAEATKSRAVGEIERARDQALKELFDVMATRVADATEHVLGRGLSDGDQQRLIDEAINSFAARPVTATRT